ncbi:MAG TPA: 30S ribosomal protein S7 [Candidatus Polarisedimenticolaceae bacterium]|nr:30S ribosomal protein S7 [Candidatus Polarisedimenticolaceae bacterium]
MPRKKTKTLTRDITPDIRYQNVLVAKMINKIMHGGKRRLAERLLYSAMDEIQTKLKVEPLEVFETAIKNVSPQVQVRAKRVGGATYQVPMEVRGDRKIHLAMIWILGAARNKSGRSFDKVLAQELMDAYNSQGDAIKKRDDTHKMADANKAFAHFARY